MCHNYGQTQDLAIRLAHHNWGYSVYTKKFRPWRLFAYKELESRPDALKLERRLKNLKSTERMLVYIKKQEFQMVIGTEK